MISDKVESSVTVWSKRLALVLLGWFGSSGYHGIFNLHQEEKVLQHVQAVDLPKLKAAVKCEDRRADKASSVAGSAILAANIEGREAPKFNDIPSDNCQHPAGK